MQPEEILDLALTLNPVAPDPTPVVARHLPALRRYPDERRALATLAGAIGVGTERLVLTNGAAEAVALVASELPVGWVSIAPREEYRAILASPQYRPRNADGGPSVWSIVCFTIDRDYRERGIASALLDAAVEHAFAGGASSVEAYPHISDPRDYMGCVSLYEAAGFERVRDANKRAIYRRERG